MPLPSEVIVANLETNITSVLKSLNVLNDSLRALKPEGSAKVIEAIASIKPFEDKNIIATLSSINKAIKDIKFDFPEVSFKREAADITKGLKEINAAIASIEIPQVDMGPVLAAIKGVKLKFSLPESFPLPADQLEALRPDYSEVISALDSLERTVKNIKITPGGGGGGPDVVGLKNLVGGRETRVNVATEETLKSIAKFNIPQFDYISAAYPDADTEVYTYRLGGAAGVIVGTITVNYVDSTKNEILNVAKT